MAAVLNFTPTKPSLTMAISKKRKYPTLDDAPQPACPTMPTYTKIVWVDSATTGKFRPILPKPLPAPEPTFVHAPDAPAPKKRKVEVASTPARATHSPPKTPKTRSPPKPRSKTRPASSSRERSATAVGSPSQTPPPPLLAPLNTDPVPRDVSLEDTGSFEGATFSVHVVELEWDLYRPFFKGQHDPKFPPVAVVEMPANSAYDEFYLMEPKDKDNYHPVLELFHMIVMMLKYLVTPKRALRKFGYNPNVPPLFQGMDIDTETDVEGSHNHEENGVPPPLTDGQHKYTIFRSLERGLHMRDLLLFLSGLERFNDEWRLLKASGEIARNIANMNGLSEELVRHICEEVYQRSVGPNLEKLKNYEAFSNNVYGELRDPLITDIIRRTNLSPTSKVLDLGSGTCNVLLQASLQTGCTSIGIENSPGSAQVGRLQTAQGEIRARMWGVNWGGGVNAVEADFTEHEERARWIREADVIVCNNQVFKVDLNDKLKDLFLDCKNGCQIVSLQPFKQLPKKDKKGNLIASISILTNPVEAIMDIQAYPYDRDWVSWTPKAGEYYIHTVDREKAMLASSAVSTGRSRSARVRR